MISEAEGHKRIKMIELKGEIKICTTPEHPLGRTRFRVCSVTYFASRVH